MQPIKVTKLLCLFLLTLVCLLFHGTCGAKDLQDRERDFRQKTIGTWVRSDDTTMATVTYLADGSLKGQATVQVPGREASVRVTGTWQIDGNTFIEMIDQTIHGQKVRNGLIYRRKIESITDDRMVLIAEDGERIVKKRSTPAGRTPEQVIDREKAMELSNSLVKAVIEDRYEDVYTRMDKVLRGSMTLVQFKKILDDVYRADCGKPLEAAFGWDEAGYLTDPSGETRPVRKFWYAVRTAKYEKGKYFLSVGIMQDGESLASYAIKITTSTEKMMQ